VNNFPEHISPLEKPEFDFEKGEVILIDKPFDWSSFDIVRKVRNAIRFKKIGHAGTLDPYATGLLIICTGKMTKKINEFQDMDKEYTGEFVLGKTTPSHDLETEFENEKDIRGITPQMIKEAAEKFKGKIMQSPPVFSAVKINGERSYKKARRGEDIKIEPKEVTVSEFEIVETELPKVKFRVVCSKGTYIRSLVRDMGNILNTGAYLSELRRTRIGEFEVNTAYSIDDFVNIVRKKNEDTLGN
jgi:tRNA pseudouridine55 synthase